MRDDILIKHIQDLKNQCEKYHTPRFSEFLDERQQSEIETDFRCMFFGGYSEAERRMIGVFPQWIEPAEDDFPLKVLKFTKKFDKEISHRNYLGTILSLGIDRCKIGDITVTDEGAYVFVSEDIAEFIRNNIYKVAGCGVDIQITEPHEITLPPKRYDIIDAVAASLRLDAVLASFAGNSRNTAKSLIISGKVSVNHKEILMPDYTLKDGDLLSVRGFGRIRLENAGGNTRSGRIHITLKKYI